MFLSIAKRVTRGGGGKERVKHPQILYLRLCPHNLVGNFGKHWTVVLCRNMMSSQYCND